MGLKRILRQVRNYVSTFSYNVQVGKRRMVVSNQSRGTIFVRPNISGERNVVRIGDDVFGTLHLTIKGNNNRVHISSKCSFNKLVVIIVANNCELSIGSATTSEGSLFHFREDGTKVVIGKDCMLACETNFWVTDFHSVLERSSGLRTNIAKSIEVDDHVWIGWGAKILKNVRIGTGSVIGTCSVVTRDVPPNTIAMGVPAVPVKSDVDWSRALL